MRSLRSSQKAIPSVRQVFFRLCKGVTTASPQVAARPATDLAPFHVAATVVLAAVGMQRAVRTQANQEQLRLVGMQTRQGLIEGGEGCLLGEGGRQAGAQFGDCLRMGGALIGCQVGIARPDLAAHPLLFLALALIARDQRVNQAFGVHPTPGMEQDGERFGAITNDGTLTREPLGQQPAQQGAFGGDAAMTLSDEPQGATRHPGEIAQGAVSQRPWPCSAVSRNGESSPI